MTSFTFRSKADLVADAIRELIDRGEVGPGAVLRQRDLAARFNVSPTPVREALRRLEAEGLVANEVHRGATVVRPTDENKAEIYGIRSVLEPYAASLACERATPEDVAAIASLHEQIAALAPDDPHIVELNRQFHRCIYEASRSALLISLIRQTWSAISGGPQVVWRPHEESVAQHAAMVEALQQRDGARLAELTRVHIEGAIGHMHRALAPNRRHPPDSDPSTATAPPTPGSASAPPPARTSSRR